MTIIEIPSNIMGAQKAFSSTAVYISQQIQQGLRLNITHVLCFPVNLADLNH